MMVLHGFAMSPNTRRVLVALEECGALYRLEPVDLMSGAHKEDAYRKLNPTARVPTLVDGDLVLWESSAALVYLAELFPEKLYGGASPAERAEIARWMFMNAAHLAPSVARIFAHTIRLPEAQRNPALVTESRAEVDRCLVAVELRLAAHEWLAERFGIADIALGATLGPAPMLGISFDKFPHVAAWLGRLQARPAWKKIYG